MLNFKNIRLFLSIFRIIYLIIQTNLFFYLPYIPSYLFYNLEYSQQNETKIKNNMKKLTKIQDKIDFTVLKFKNKTKCRRKSKNSKIKHYSYLKAFCVIFCLSLFQQFIALQLVLPQIFNILLPLSSKFYYLIII